MNRFPLIFKTQVMKISPIFTRAGKPGPRRGRPVKSFEWVLNKADINFKNMVWKCWFKNVIGRNTSFCHLLDCWSTYSGILTYAPAIFAPKSLTKEVFGYFSRSGLLTKWEKLSFSSPWGSTTLKIPYFCQNRNLNSFH